MKLVQLIFLVIALSLFSASAAYCQYEPPVTAPKADDPSAKLRGAYLGVGTGLYSKYGLLGVAAGIRVSKYTLAEFTLGLGNNGAKMGGSLTFNVKGTNGWCPSIGFGRSTGFEVLGKNQDIKVLYLGKEETANGNIQISGVNLLFLSFQKQILSKKGNRFVMEFGYSIPLGPATYGFADSTVTINKISTPVSSVQLTDKQKSDFNLTNPSGLMISFSYHFGLKTKD